MAGYYNEFTQILEGYLNEKNRFTDILEKVEKATGVKRLYITEGLLGLVSLYMILGHFAAFICNGIGFVYPAYASIIALETSNKEDDTKWLTYWVVFAFFSVMEFFSDIIFSWFPFYWLFKVGFLIWCFLPIQGNGSLVVYNRFIRPVFLKNRTQLDNSFNSAVNEASGFAGKAFDSVSKFAAKSD